MILKKIVQQCCSYLIQEIAMALRSPAADRNKESIFEELTKLIEDKRYNILEIASGTGQHVDYFARRMPNCQWTPTDLEKHHLDSINEYCRELRNVNRAVMVDISKPVNDWPEVVKGQQFDVMLCINLIHISPWICTQGLFRGASELLSSPNGLLVTYGPYAEDGVLQPESNVRFDQGLRAQDPEWGVRDIRDLRSLSEANGLRLCEKIALPANNHLLVFKRV